MAMPTSKVWIQSPERRLKEFPVSDLNLKAALRVISKVHHVTEWSNIFEMHYYCTVMNIYGIYPRKGNMSINSRWWYHIYYRF